MDSKSSRLPYKSWIWGIASAAGLGALTTILQWQAGSLDTSDVALNCLVAVVSGAVAYFVSEIIESRREILRKLATLQQDQHDLLELTRTNSKYNDLTQRALELNSTNSRIVVLGGITTVLNKIAINEAQKEIKFEGEHIALASYVQWWERLSKLQKIMKRDGKAAIEVFVTQSTPIYLWNPEKNPLQYEMVEAQRQFCQSGGKIARILVHQSDRTPRPGEAASAEFQAEAAEYESAFREMQGVGDDVFYIARQPAELAVDRRKDFMTCETPVLASLNEQREVVSYLWETDHNREQLERGILHFGRMPEPGLMQKWYDVFSKILIDETTRPDALGLTKLGTVPDYIAARATEFGCDAAFDSYRQKSAAE